MLKIDPRGDAVKIQEGCSNAEFLCCRAEIKPSEWRKEGADEAFSPIMPHKEGEGSGWRVHTCALGLKPPCFICPKGFFFLTSSR